MRITALLLAVLSVPASAAEPAAFGYYLHGSAGNAVPAQTPQHGGALLAGGGNEVDAGYGWLAEQARGGDLVVLRARGEDQYNEYFAQFGRLDSVETLVVGSREAANDPFVAKRVLNADALFIAGGDQANYINFWKGTALGDAIEALLRRRIAIGGTSAGLAVQGQYDFAALNDTISTEEALKDPYQPKMTLDTGFITAPGLAHTITDSHFAERDRMGRLLAFMARLIVDGKEPAGRLRAIGIDPATTLVVEGDKARVVGEGAVYFLSANGKPADCRPGQPLRFENVSVIRLKNGDRFDLKSWQAGEGQPLRYRVSTADGRVWSDRADGGVY